MPDKQRTLAFVILLLLVDAFVLFAVAVRQSNVITDLRDAQRDITSRFRSVERERGAFEKLLKRLPLTPSPVLAGYDVTADSMVQFNDMTAAIYILSPGCAACAINLPLLNETARSMDLRVIAVAFTTDISELEVYARDHQLAFPLLANPMGTVLNVIPRHTQHQLL